MFSITELNAQARRLPFGMPEFTPHAGTPLPTSESELSEQAKAMLTAWKPVIEKADWAHAAGTSAYRKQFELSTKLVLAQMVTNIARLPEAIWQREATLAGTDIPSYQRQMLGTILRAYPRLFAIQLFGVVPLNGPDGRVFFRDFAYDSTMNAAAPKPAVAPDDRTDDLTKFRTDYFKVGQGAAARKLKLAITSMTVSVESYRVVGDWYYEGEDDYAALYGGNLGNALTGHMGDMLQWVTDRVMIDTALANVPAAHVVTWTAQPDGTNGTPNYAGLSPSEKKVYDESIWSDGILPLLTKLNTARLATTPPNWAIGDSASIERLMKLTTFVPNGDLNGVDLTSGPIRDVGTLRQVGIRVICDPQMAANTILFGRRPTSDFDPCISFLPYRPIRVTGTHEDPGSGGYERGVYSRFGVAVPDGAVAASSQLADVYGKLVIA